MNSKEKLGGGMGLSPLLPILRLAGVAALFFLILSCVGCVTLTVTIDEDGARLGVQVDDHTIFSDKE
jgi:hypothetical protein